MDQHLSDVRASPPRFKQRKASMADPIRGKDERDEMEEEMIDEMDMGDADESATQYSTDIRR